MATKKKTLTKEEKDSCRIVTPKFRLSYPHLFKPHSPPGSEKAKYQITMLFPKDEALEGINPITKEKVTLKGAIRNAKIASFGPKKFWPADLQSPFSDGDDPKYANKEGYKGHWVVKAISSEDQKPLVIDKDMSPIMDANDIYPGCYARASLVAYTWEFMGKKGVGFILDHVQKVKDGKPFSSKPAVEQVFSPVEDEEDFKDEDSDDEDDE